LPAPDNASHVSEFVGASADAIAHEIGFAILLPHARIRGLVNDLAAFVRTREAVPFAPDGRRVCSFLALLVPVGCAAMAEARCGAVVVSG